MHRRGHTRRGRPRKAAKATLKKEDLVPYETLQAKIKDLEEENKRLSALLSRNSDPPCSSPASSAVPSSTLSLQTVNVKRKRSTESKSCSPQQRIVLLVACLGQDPFQGSQGSKAGSSLRPALLHALKVTSLVENVSSCQLHGCSSDKVESSEAGQHPFEVMVAVTVQRRVRTPHLTHSSETRGGRKAKVVADAKDDCEEDLSQDINYCALLNEVLPEGIRVLAWCPVPSDFVLPASSSPDTLHTYKYFFPRGSIKVEDMNIAAQQLLGQHKAPLPRREIVRISVSEGGLEEPQREESTCVYPQGKPTKSAKRHPRRSQDTMASEGPAEYRVCVLTLTGRGFTWMDVRKVVSALMSVGRSAEDEGLEQLLSMEAILRGQELSLPEETSLHLFHTDLGEGQQWVWNREALTSIVPQLQQYWACHAVRAAASQAFLQGYEAVLAGVPGTADTPQAHSQNTSGQSTAHCPLSSSTVPTDHEYSAVMKKGRRQGMSWQDHEYSAVLEKGSRKGTTGRDSGHKPSMESLLVQLMKPLVGQLMGKDRSREAALLKLHSQIVHHSVPCSLATVTQAWQDLLASYDKAQQQRRAGQRVDWEHFEVLDTLLSGYGQHSSVSENSTSQLQAATRLGSPTDAATKSLRAKNSSEEEEDVEDGEDEEVDQHEELEEEEEVEGSETEEEDHHQELEEEEEEDVEGDEGEMEDQHKVLEVMDNGGEMVLLVEPSSLAMHQKESTFFKVVDESLVTSPSRVSKSSAVENIIIKSEPHSIPSPQSPCPFSLSMSEEEEEEEEEDSKVNIKKDLTLSNAGNRQNGTIYLKKLTLSKRTRDENREEDRTQKVKKEKLSEQSSPTLYLHHEMDDVFAIEATGDKEEEEDRTQKGNKEKHSEQSSRKLYLHHEKDDVFAIETGHRHTTDPTDIFLEYQLYRGLGRKGRLQECLSDLAENNAHKEAYRRRKERMEVEALAALSDIDVACQDLKTGLMEV